MHQSKGGYVADALGRTMLLPTDVGGWIEENKDAGGLPQYQEVLGHDKALET